MRNRPIKGHWTGSTEIGRWNNKVSITLHYKEFIAEKTVPLHNPICDYSFFNFFTKTQYSAADFPWWPPFFRSTTLHNLQIRSLPHSSTWKTEKNGSTCGITSYYVTDSASCLYTRFIVPIVTTFYTVVPFTSRRYQVTVFQATIWHIHFWLLHPGDIRLTVFQSTIWHTHFWLLHVTLLLALHCCLRS